MYKEGAAWAPPQEPTEEPAVASSSGASSLSFRGARLDRFEERPPRARLPSLERLRLENVPVRIISFGTRTLTFSHKWCAPARELMQAMWGDKDRGLQVRDRNKLFNTTLASRAVCEVLNWTLSGSSEGPLQPENVYFVCCTVLHDGSE